MSEMVSRLQHHFADYEHQYETAQFGMWAFLLTEIMFFGGAFCAYIVYRSANPDAFAQAAHHLPLFWGTLNTAVLIGSSLTMAMAVRCGQTSDKAGQVRYLLATMVLGAVFLGIKAIEYSDKFAHHLVPGANFIWDGPASTAGGAEIYFSLYFAMTGLHALHMVIGMGIMAVIARMAARGDFTAQWYTPVECLGLYWHFVDLVWIYLFPLLYLIGRHG